MATRSNSDEQRNLKALKLLRSRAEALDASFQRVFTRSWAMSWSTGLHLGFVLAGGGLFTTSSDEEDAVGEGRGAKRVNAAP